MPNEDAAQPGTFCWHELATTKPEEAVAFYSKLFGWGTSVMDMGDAGDYTVFEQDGESVAGVMPVVADEGESEMSNWLNYIEVESLEDKVSEAEGLGAQIALPPTEIPSVGRICVLFDPTGAVFALFQAIPIEEED